MQSVDNKHSYLPVRGWYKQHFKNLYESFRDLFYTVLFGFSFLKVNYWCRKFGKVSGKMLNVTVLQLGKKEIYTVPDNTLYIFIYIRLLSSDGLSCPTIAQSGSNRIIIPNPSPADLPSIWEGKTILIEGLLSQYPVSHSYSTIS